LIKPEPYRRANARMLFRELATETLLAEQQESIESGMVKFELV